MRLRARAAWGAKWTAASTMSSALLLLAQMVVLARILSPAEFGLIALVLIVVNFSHAFADLGLTNAIVQRGETRPRQLSVLFWLNLLAGGMVFLLVLLLSGPIASFYDQERLVPLLRLAGIVFVVQAIGQPFHAVLQKALKFDRLAKAELAFAVSAAAVTIALALAGTGATSFVVGQIGGAAVRTLVLVVFGARQWRPGLKLDWEGIAGFLHFGGYQMGERSLNYLSANIDYILIGKFLGPEILGAYTIAYQIVVVPLQKINPILTRVAFPVLALRQNDNTKLRAGYLEMTKLLACVALPILAGIAATAHLFVPLLFGKGWELVVPLIQILALVGALKSIGNPAGIVYLAKGMAAFNFRWNALVSGVNAVVFLIAVQSGVFALAWAYAAVAAGYFAIGRLLMERIIGLPWRTYLVALRTASFAAGTMLVAVVAFDAAAAGLVGPLYARFLLDVIVGAATYLSAVVVIDRAYVRGVWSLLMERPEAT